MIEFSSKNLFFINLSFKMNTSQQRPTHIEKLLLYKVRLKLFEGYFLRKDLKNNYY
jgi:hypothetical protein